MLPVPPTFHEIDWSDVPEELHPGESGAAYWRTKIAGDLRLRMVRYTAGYVADHWCTRGHVLHVLSGELRTELEDGRHVLLKPGMGYVVGDNGAAHKSSTVEETTLFIVD